MPSIDQCEGASAAGALTALPSSLPASENGKDSHSEESFHLLLDDDDNEHQSSEGDKEVHYEETENQIINKFETKDEEKSILEDEEDQFEIKIELNDVNGSEKEFKSFYEVRVEPDCVSEPMEANEDTSQLNGNAAEDSKGMGGEDINVATCIDKLEQEKEKPLKNGVAMESDSCDIKVTESKTVSFEEPKSTELTDSVDRYLPEESVKKTNESIDESESKAMSSAVVEPTNNPANVVTEGILDETNVQKSQEEMKNDDTVLESVSEPKVEAEMEEIKVSESDKQDEQVSEAKDEAAEERKSLEEVLPGNKDSVFKVPEELPKEEPETNKKEPEVTSDKLNDKTEDGSDLLDVTMLRGTEDDACVVADIMTKINIKTSEISDKERMDAEQETSVGKEEDFDVDNATGFNETDDESYTSGEDDSSSYSHTKTNAKDASSFCSHTNQGNKIVKISNCSNNATTSSIDEEPALVQKVEVGEPVVADARVTEVINDKEKSEQEKDKSDIIVLVKPKKTDKLSDKPEEDSKAVKEVTEATASDKDLVVEETEKNIPENDRIFVNKRVLVLSESETDGTLSPKKAKIELEAAAQPIPNHARPEKLKVLTDFAKFMQCRNLTAKLTRSDLEQFCIQKICECLMLKSSESDLQQKIKKNEKTLEGLRKDVAELSKQCKDLDIINKKLMSEMRNPNGANRPLVPLKITRSVGLQVRLSPISDPGQYRDKRPSVSGSAITSPQKQEVAFPAVNKKVGDTPTQTSVGVQTSSAVRQVLQSSPENSALLTSAPATTSNNTLLDQTLETRSKPAIASKRTPAPTTPAKKPTVVIVDLTDEDDEPAKLDKPSNTIKTVSRGGESRPTNKAAPAKASSSAIKRNIIRGKHVVVAKIVPEKQNTTLPKGIRLAQAIKTSSATGSPQMVYVVPTSTNAGGQQKVSMVNIQPTIPGQTVSVLSSTNPKTTTSGLALKSVATGGSGGGDTGTTRPQKLTAPPPAVPVTLDHKLKPLLPKPHLMIKRIDTGIILQWKMPYNLDQYELIASYQLYAYQGTSAPPNPNNEMWRKVGEVKALALPMACTLTQFVHKNTYYFAVRPVDVHKRTGEFSDPKEILL